MKLSMRADSTSSHHSVLHILPPSCLRYRCDGRSFSSLVDPHVTLKYGSFGLKLDGEIRNRRVGGAWGPEDDVTAQ